MTLSVRFLPVTGGASIRHGSGRAYQVAGAAVVDVPYTEAENMGPDQGQKLMVIGTTAERPTAVSGRTNWPPVMMYDTTLGKPIFAVANSFPTVWKDITGATV
jgi:hypothetical protein